MKGKDKKALHSKTLVELNTLLKEKRDQLMKAKMEIATNKLKNVHAAKLFRGEIAILETIKKARSAVEKEAHV